MLAVQLIPLRHGHALVGDLGGHVQGRPVGNAQVTLGAEIGGLVPQELVIIIEGVARICLVPALHALAQAVAQIPVVFGHAGIGDGGGHVLLDPVRPALIGLTVEQGGLVGHDRLPRRCRVVFDAKALVPAIAVVPGFQGQVVAVYLGQRGCRGPIRAAHVCLGVEPVGLGPEEGLAL